MSTPLQILITYKLSDNQLQRIKDTSKSIEVHCAPDPAEAKKYYGSAEVLFGDIPKELFHQLSSLSWVQIATVGADRFLYPELLQSEVVLCCARGMHKHQMTELLFGQMIAIARKLYLYRELQAKHEWSSSLIKESSVLVGATLGIVGLGSIGSHMAMVGKSFGMNVIGTKRTPQPVDHVDEVLPPSKLEKLLKSSDHVVNVAPLTLETRKMFGEKEFGMMKATSVFYNFGRAASIDDHALIKALEEGTIRAAALDTFDEEPLPKHHPLWTAKNVFITPHAGGPIPHYNHLLTEVFIDNLLRYLDGLPLATVVDKAKGY